MSVQYPSGFTGTMHEWHVAGDAGPGYPPYNHTFSDPDGAKAEAQARALIGGRFFRTSVRDVQLWYRAVTFGEWEPVEEGLDPPDGDGQGGSGGSGG